MSEKNTLYSSTFEHDACGIGAVININGKKSHETVDNALKIVEKLEHRAGKDAKGETGDGVGIMVQVSYKFFKDAAAKCGITLKGDRQFGVGMFFLPNDRINLSRRKKLFEIIVEKEGLEFLGWREVPTNPDVLGSRAVECMPSIWQCFINRPEDMESDLDFDRKLYVIRREFEHSITDGYVVSLSCRTIVYKGMFLVHQLESSIATFRAKNMSPQ